MDEQSLVYELTPELSFSPGDAMREKRQLSLIIFLQIACSIINNLPGGLGCSFIGIIISVFQWHSNKGT